MSSALVLEGGAMRGIFSAGVLDVFMEQGIVFEAAIGISAGACFGINYKSGQIGRSIRYNKRFCNDKRYCSIDNLLRTGDIYGADFCYRKLPFELDIFDCKAFEENPMDFYVGATDVVTGKPVYHKLKDCKDKDLEWIRASASMPVVSNIVKVDGYSLLDGGVSDSIPYRYMEKLGYDRNVIILTQTSTYRKKKTKAIPLIRLKYLKYPGLVYAMEHRHEMYNKQLKGVRKREKEGTAFVIRPPEELNISRTESNPEELERVYRMGRAEAIKRLPELKEFLRK
ncbi:MAG: patatin family protein [Lachnospiraceae bacterium]|nr:patatin family protein [Lachnospiraceae bacterium]